MADVKARLKIQTVGSNKPKTLKGSTRLATSEDAGNEGAESEDYFNANSGQTPLTTPIPSSFIPTFKSSGALSANPSSSSPSNLLQALFEKNMRERKLQLNYLKSLFIGQGLYFGICRVPLREIAKFYGMSPESASRATRLFQLGMGVGGALRTTSSLQFARTLDLLFHEYESSLDGGNKQTSKSIFSRKKDVDTTNQILEVYNPPFPLDFISTVLGMVEMMLYAYNKMTARNSSAPATELEEVVLRVDQRFLKTVIGPLMRDVETIGSTLMTIALNEI